tara:strand:- start:1135 stop:1440 length:306 start_codon:yes stop_codon:yes gene_type:complete
MEYYKYGNSEIEGVKGFYSSIWLNLLTETEMCAFFRSTDPVIKDTALLMTNRNWIVNVESTRFDDVMSACVAENIFTNDRVAEFKRGVIQISAAEWTDGSN